MSSSWFGESLANIKGQITNFTKEVLTADDEEEAPPLDAEEVQRLKTEVVNLTQKCKEQSDLIQDLRTKETNLEDRCSASELQSRTCKDSYQQLLRISETEKAKLTERVVQLEAIGQEHVQVQTSGNDVEETGEEKESKKLEGQKTLDHIQRKDEFTETEAQFYDELFVRELEDRCSSYQSDLFVIRNELMNIQRQADLVEETNAKFNADISLLLESEFRLDGQSLFKPSAHQSTSDGNSRLISKLKELSFLWKDLVEKKSTLERTVAKLSIPHSSASQAEATSVIHSTSTGQSPHSSNNSNIIDLFNEPFFPPKIDSFGLETILEEDRGEDEARRIEPSTDLIYEEGYGGTCQVGRKGTPTTISSNCSTQTDLDEDLEEPTSDKEPTNSILASQANELAMLQDKAVKWSQDEVELVSKLAERDSRIGRLELDLGRLRSHLVDLEEQTTGEALLSAKREEQLQLQLSQLKNELSRALQQNEPNLGVMEEITKLTQERNSYRNANSGLEDQISKLNAQLQNLHFVLEQFQREKELELSSVEKRLGLEMRQLEQKNEMLGKELENERILFERAKSGLDAAHQLNAQIEDKTKTVLQLKTQVQEKEEECKKMKSKMDEVTNTLDGKIDRYLIKNLVVGYFSAADDKRNEVLRLLATVLDFNREDRQKTGLESGFSLWPIGRRSSATASAAAMKDKQSLSEAFINFLENESKPKVELRMSVDEVTRSSRSTDSPSSVLMASPGGNIGTESPLAEPTSGNRVTPEISMSLPVLNQADRSNSILKDILNPKP